MARHERGRSDVTPHELTNAMVTSADLDVPALPPLLVRVAAARRLIPPPSAICRDCWLRGRDAAIRRMEAVGTVDGVVPSVSDRHVLVSFASGIAAARAAMGGA